MTRCYECNKDATYTWWRSCFTTDGSLEPVGDYCELCAETEFPDGALYLIGETPSGGN